MKAITTRYIGQTDRKPARYVATDMDGNRAEVNAADVVDDGGIGGFRGHRAAAEAFCKKLGWDGAETLIGGSIKGGRVFVFPPEPPTDA